MATLDNSNVVNGQTVEATDITQLYTALGTGNPGTITGLVMTGSLNGDVQGTSTNANFARINNNTTTPTIYSVLFADSTVTSGNAQIYADSGSNGSGMHYQPSTDTLTVTASYANEVVSASYASIAGVSETSKVEFSVDSLTPASFNSFTPFAGYAPTILGITQQLDMTQVFGITGTAVIGVNLFITANQVEAPTTGTSTAIGISIQSNVITFEGATGPVVYHGWYIDL